MVEGIDATEKRYIYQLMSNVQLPGSITFDSKIPKHSCTPKKDASMAKEYTKHLSKEHRKHGVIDEVKYREISSKRKWTDREYHVQYNADVAHKYVKIYCDTNQFPAIPFCGSHPKPHGARGLSKNYHLRFYPKTRSWNICNSMHTMCLSWMYINTEQTLDLWYSVNETVTLPTCHQLYLLASSGTI